VRTVLVGNVGTLTAGLQLLPDASPEDGALDVALVAPRSPWDWVVLVVGGLIGRHRPDRRLELLRGRHVEVRTRRSEARQVDGELIDDGRGFTAQIDPAALVVRVPRSPEDDDAPRASGDTPAHTPAHPSESTP
jgi:diacylglycerol kinase family enzyme